MKNFILIVGILLIAMQAHADNSNINYLSCNLSGNNLIQNTALNDLSVTNIAPSTFSLTLGETLDQGTYLTYVHLTLRLNESTLTVATNSMHASILRTLRDEKNPYAYSIYIQSLIDSKQSMKINLECNHASSEYLFIPINKYDNSALNGHQNVPETLSTLANHLNDDRFNTTEFLSISEFLATNYCITGSAEEALEEIKELTSQFKGFWRHRALDANQIIAPRNLKLENKSIKWNQPYETATCFNGHHETYEDSDGIPQDVFICDQYKVSQELPLQLSIKNCSKL